MTHENMQEIHRLLSLSENEFKEHLFNSLEKGKQNKIKANSKDRSKIKQTLKLQVATLNNYELKVKPYLITAKENVCKLYCITRPLSSGEIEQLAEQVEIMLEIATDPTLITFTIRYILKKICKCDKGRRTASIRHRTVGKSNLRLEGKLKIYNKK